MNARIAWSACVAILLALPLLASADPAGAAPARKAGAGSLRIHYRPARDPAHQDFPEVLRRSGEFEAIAEDIDASFVLPADLDVSFEECGEANASYSPDERSISMCYELIARYVDVLTEPSDPRDVVEDEAELDDVAYWDEHGLSAQRFYNLACFVYGSNPGEYGDLVSELEGFDERADQCPGEYRQKVRSWDILLAPHRKAKASTEAPKPGPGGS